MKDNPSSKENKRGRNIFSKYIRIDFKTLQGRITMGFLSMGLFALIMLVSSNRAWNKQLNNAQQLVQINKNSSIKASEIQQMVDLTTILSFRYLSTDDSFFSEDVAYRWLNDIYPTLDHLDSLLRNSQEVKVKAYLKELAPQIDKVKSQQLAAINSNDINTLTDADLIEDIIHLTYLITSIKEELAEEEKQVLETLNAAEKNITTLIIIEFLIAAIISLLIALYIIRSVLLRIKFLKVQIREISHGNLPEQMEHSKDEMNSIIKALNELTLNLKGITDFAEEVGRGHFDSEIEVFDNKGQLGESLAEMRNKLQNVSEEDKKRDWFNTGIAKFSDILRTNNDSIETLSTRLTSELVTYLNANQGAIFVVNSENNQIKIQLKGAYAYNRQKFINKEINPGQGLVGQCYLEKEYIYLSEIPENYVAISSGLGEATPTHLLICPMKINDDISGIIELASFKPFQAHHIDFVEKVGESIASTIKALSISLETRSLLEESQMRAEQLQAQEEEMRQNAEELEATQEEMERQSREMGAFNLAVKESAILLEMEIDGIISNVNRKFEDVFGYKSNDIIGKSQSFIRAQQETAHADFEAIVSHLKTGKAKQQIIDCRKRNGDNIRLYADYFPIKESNGVIRKIECLCFELTGLEQN
jgi:PAS domain S-box-containing protein